MRTVLFGTRAILVVTALAMAAFSATAVGDKKAARFAKDNVKSVDTHTAEVSFEVDKELLASKSVWVGVIPLQAPSSVWLQSVPVLSAGSHERVVYLGLEGVSTRAKFHVVLLSCPKNALKKDGELRISDATELGVEFLDTISILRTK